MRSMRSRITLSGCREPDGQRARRQRHVEPGRARRRRAERLLACLEPRLDGLLELVDQAAELALLVRREPWRSRANRAVTRPCLRPRKRSRRACRSAAVDAAASAASNWARNSETEVERSVMQSSEAASTRHTKTGDAGGGPRQSNADANAARAPSNVGSAFAVPSRQATDGCLRAPWRAWRAPQTRPARRRRARPASCGRP